MTPPRVLIVDDSRLTRNIIKSALSAAGYEVAGEAVNGREGIELTGRLKPDLVTVDFTMPEKGGLESLEEIRDAHPGAKIIVVTALGSQKLLQEDAMKAGALAMINKPFNPFELVRTADRLLGRADSLRLAPSGLPVSLSGDIPAALANGLSREQLEDLMEVGNIGAGNAASRLSDLIRRRCLISPPQVAFLPLPELRKLFASNGHVLASLGIKVLGDIPAVMVVVIPRDQAAAIVRYMTEDPGKEKDLSAAARFALKQVGEFMTRAFSQAVNQFILDQVQRTMPEVSVADSPQDAEELFKNGGEGPSLLIHCGFSDTERSFEGKLAYVLAPAAQKDVITRLNTLLSGKS